MCNQIPTNSNQIVEIKSILVQNTNFYIVKYHSCNDSSHRADKLFLFCLILKVR